MNTDSITGYYPYVEFCQRAAENDEIFKNFKRDEAYIDVVQTVNGVRNCNLVDPKSNIFFNFDLKNLTKEQLLEYGPEHIYFERENIVVKVI